MSWLTTRCSVPSRFSKLCFVQSQQREKQSFMSFGVAKCNLVTRKTRGRDQQIPSKKDSSGFRLSIFATTLRNERTAFGMYCRKSL
jgi:hypothetical protein